MNDPVKAKIIELVPDIMELAYGCLVIYKFFGDLGTFEAKCRYSHRVGNRHYVIDENDHVHFVYSKEVGKEELKVLGRPITLADVLRAMEKISDETRVWMGVLTTGQIFHNAPHNDSNAFYQIIDCTWNLATHYDGQTQEVKDFIGKLLGV